LTLLFKTQFLPKIREGKKTQTRRLKQPRLKIGRSYHITKKYNTTKPEKVKILNIFQQKLGEISEEEINKEGFNTKQEFIKAWKAIYGNYDPEATIWVIEFQYLPQDRNV
jgi:hypothetical protein